MSREVDERVVAMYFDNKDFQKNAKATIETLDELKQNLKLEKATEGFEALKKASSELKLDEVTTKAKNLKSEFSKLGSVVKSVFDFGTSPIRSISNIFSTFQSYVNKFIGFDLASKVVGGLENAIRNLTINPIFSGFNEYELKMDSIKTIMSGSGESLEVVKEQLEELNEYADKTVYSFSDMTSNIGKFTNNNVKLEDATAAMKGIANATADAGQGAQQASMAMYNISQAFGVGSMKMIDWKSLENANIATVRLKNTFIQAGVAQGKLTRQVQKDAKTGTETVKYFVKGFESGTNAVEVTAENFRESLNKEWLDKDTMLDAFKIYSGEIQDINELRRMGFTEGLGFTDEDIQKLLDIGTAASSAATEVRTFSKMYDALKEAAQSGWAKVIELILGDMEEGTSLWTTLNNKISGVLDNTFGGMEEAFSEWRGMYKDRDEVWRKTEDMFVTEQLSLDTEERKAAEKEQSDLQKDIKAKKQELEQAKKDLKKVKGEEEQATAKDAILALEREIAEDEARLDEITEQLISGKGAKEVTKQIMEALPDGREVLVSSFMELMETIGSIGKMVSAAWTDVFGKLDSDRLWSITNRFKEFTSGLKAWLGEAKDTESRLSKLRRGLTGVFTIMQMGMRVISTLTGIAKKAAKPVLEVFVELFGKFGEWVGTFKGLNLGESLTKLGNDFQNLWSKLTNISWDSIKDKIAGAFNSVKDSITDWLNKNGLGSVVDKLSEWKNALKSKWDQIVAWFNSSGIGTFFTNAWGWITSQFKSTTYTDVDEKGNKVTVEGQSPVAKFLSDTWEAIKEIWEKVTEWFKGAGSGVGSFLSDTWGWIVSQFTPTTYRDVDEKGNRVTVQGQSPVAEFLNNTWTSIKGVWEEVKAWFEGAGSTIGSFLSDTWGWIVSQFTPTTYRDVDEKGNRVTVTGKSPVAQTITDIWQAIERAWTNLNKWEGWTSLARFFGDVWAWIENKTRESISGVRGFFTVDENGKSGFITMLENIRTNLTTAWNNIVGWEGWGAVGQFFSDIWGWVTNLINGDKSASAGSEDGPAQVVKDMAENINEAAYGSSVTPESVDLLTRIMTSISDFMTKFKEMAETVMGITGIDKLLAVIDRMYEVIVQVLDVVSRVIHAAVVDGNLGAWFQILIVGITGLVASITSSRIKLKLAQAAADSEGIGETILKIGLAFLAIAAAVAILAKIDETSPESLQNALSAMIGLVAAIGIFAVVYNLTKVNSQAVQQTAITGVERFFTKAIKWAAVILLVKVAFDGITEVVNSMKGSTVNGDDILNIVESVVMVIAGVGLTMAIVGRLSGGDVKILATTAVGILAGLAILLTGLEALFGGVGWLANVLGAKDVIVQNIEAAGEIFGAVSAAIGQMFAGFGRGRNKEANKTSEDDLEWAGKMAERFTPERMIAIERLFESVNTLTSIVPDSTKMSNLTTFADQMPKLGEALAKFSWSFTGAFKDLLEQDGQTNIDPTQGLEQAKQQVDYITDLVQSMKEFDSFFRFHTDLPGWAAHPEGLMSEVNPETFSQLGSIYASAAMALVTAVQQGLNEGEIEKLSTVFDATPIVDSIVIALGLGQSAIAKAVHNMVQEGINASNTAGDGGTGYDTSGLFGSSGLFGENGLNLGLGNLDLSSVLTQAIGGVDTAALSTQINEKFGGLSGQLTGMFDIGTLQDQMKDYFPIGEDGELDSSFLEEWQTKFETIGQELENEGVQVTITPVFDTTDLHQGIQSINHYFETNPILANLATGLPETIVNVDLSETNNEIQVVNQNLVTLTAALRSENSSNISAIHSLGSNITAIASAIRAMRIYLDTGVLAGAVDDELGIRMLLAGRTG